MKKLAVVLFNLGGPDQTSAIRPFLFNLFNDPQIISLPQPFRWLLAHWISFRRAPVAKQIYNHIGGKSPILEQTILQQRVIESDLENIQNFSAVKVFTAMRYWHPMLDQTMDEVMAWNADEIVLLPLYPQFSTTTSGSSFHEWQRLSRKKKCAIKTRFVCCYPDYSRWVNGFAQLIVPVLVRLQSRHAIRILFSAHGLPQKIVDKGDPYVTHVELGVEAIVKTLNATEQVQSTFDYAVCYQSRVGPMAWTTPSLDDELIRTAADKMAVIVVPVSFVSEHSETLYELDIEYKDRARELGISEYHRIPALSGNKEFLAGLSDLVRLSLENQNNILVGVDFEKCRDCHIQCPHNSFF